jgi:hypothetical protein
MGKEGDPNFQNGPSWKKHGSLIAYRDIQFYVFEFEKFLEETVKTLYPQKYPRPQDWDSRLKKDVEFLGARMNGRWKSGEQITLFPLVANIVVLTGFQGHLLLFFPPMMTNSLGGTLT